MPNRVGLRYVEWPLADRHAWERATNTGDFFADDAHASHWRPKTRYQALTAYGRWLAFVAEREPDALQRKPETRTSQALLAAYIDAVSQRVTATSVVAESNHVRQGLRAVAP